MDSKETIHVFFLFFVFAILVRALTCLSKSAPENCSATIIAKRTSDVITQTNSDEQTNVQSDSIHAKVFNYYSFIVFLCKFLLSVYTSYFLYFLYAYICIHCFNFTIHLIMTEVRSKCRFLPLIFIIKFMPIFLIDNSLLRRYSLLFLARQSFPTSVSQNKQLFMNSSVLPNVGSLR